MAEAPEQNMRSRVMRGLVWKAVSQVVLQGSRSIAAIVFARLLVPEEFGLAMMAVVASSLVLIFSDLALGAALIHRDQLTQADRSTVFWTSVMAGAVFTVLGVALSWPIAGFYGEPRVQPLFAAISLSFIITALGTTHATLLQREMDFRRLETRMMLGILAGAAAGIVAAALGFGAWAIIVQQLASAVVSTILVWISLSWRPSLQFSMASLRALFGFSANVFGSRMLFYLSRNADSLIIGRAVGAAALGAYTIAYNIMLVPFARIAGPLQEVLFPAFSRIQDDPRRMGAIWLRVNRVVAAISLPAMLGLTVVAADFVTVILGSRWSAVIPVIQILAWVGFVQSLVRLNSSVLQACDRTGLLLRWSMLIGATNVVAFVIGVRWGIVGVAWAYAITNTILQPVNIWQTGRVVSISLREFVRSLSGLAQATAMMIVVVLPLRLLLVEEGIPAAARLAICVLVGAFVYGIGCLLCARDVVAELWRLRRARIGAAPAAVAAA